MKCEICGKSVKFGDNISHSKRHTRRHWTPNIHSARVTVGGKTARLNVCTRCLRTQHKVEQAAPAKS